MEDKISVAEIIKIYGVEPHFFDELEDAGLVKTIQINDVRCIDYSQLADFERLINLHYDLEVNVAGLEIIHNLLEQIQTLQEENKRLMAKN